MPTASSGLPDRSGSDKSRRARLSKDDDRLLSDGPADDDLAVDATDDDLAAIDLDATDTDDAAEDADLDDADLDDDDSDADDDEDDDGATGTTLTKKRTAKASARAGSRTRTTPTKARRPKDQRTGNPFVFLARFIREVVGEMRKVLWPTRRELVVYTIAVIIFVTVLVSIVGGLDFGFARLILLIFG